MGVTFLAAALGASTPGNSDVATPAERAVVDSANAVVRGHVRASDGTPVANAVVVSTAGGQTVSEADGSFALELPFGAIDSTLRLTAVASVHGVNHTGSISTVHRRDGANDIVAIVVAQSASCDPSWLPNFDIFPGMSGDVLALTTFDDGSGAGPALVAGGTFTMAGSTQANRIARWNGSMWTAMGSGMNGTVRALASFDSGSGSGATLYAGGDFTTAGGTAAKYVARWNGAAWSALGSGTSDVVHSLLAVNANVVGGPALYVGGKFATAGGVDAKRIARWNGSSWSAVGSGMTGDVCCATVYAMTLFDDGLGEGPSLYAGGHFFTAGSVSAQYIARWNGTNWSKLGTGMNSPVRALSVFDEGLGEGPALFAGGEFTLAGGTPAKFIARWDGTAWTSVGNPAALAASCHALAALDDGSGGGPALYAGGGFTAVDGMSTNHVARWDGTAWSPVGSGVSGYVRTMAVFDAGASVGPRLCVGGEFNTAGDVTARRLAQWDGAGWSPFGRGLDGKVLDLATFDDGSGAGLALYAAGEFTGADGVALNYVARWDGSSWTSLGTGLNDKASVLLGVDDDIGGGRALYVGGHFTTAGGLDAKRIARWDGARWSALGSGMDNYVSALALFDDGSGAALYAGGLFVEAGGTAAQHLAKWDGTAWSPCSTGTSPGGVGCLRVLDDGSGAGDALYVGGNFETAGGIEAHKIARWDGRTWSTLGSGLSGGNGVSDIIAFDDDPQGGTSLYVCGSFTTAGGAPAKNIARWDGRSWSPLAGGLSSFGARMTIFDDGTGGGPALYVGGLFQNASGVPAQCIARWDGFAWSGMGSAMVTPPNPYIPNVTGFATFDDGSGQGPALFVGGAFWGSAAGDSFIARWQGCSTTEPADLNGDGVVNTADLSLLLSAWGQSGGTDLNGDGTTDASDLTMLLAAWTT